MKSEKRLIDANRLIQDINADPYRTESEKSYVRCLVSRQPTIDVVEVVHGKVTEYESDEWYGPIYQCHECGCEMMVREPVGRWEDVPIRPKLCANCGAMFDGERKDND